MRLAESKDSASTCLSEASCATVGFSTSLPNQKDHTGRQWFWILLPKQKDLGCRAETRQYFNIVGALGRWVPAYNRGYDGSGN